MNELEKIKAKLKDLKSTRNMLVLLVVIFSVIALGTALYDWMEETYIISKDFDTLILFLGGICGAGLTGLPISTINSNIEVCEVEAEYQERLQQEKLQEEMERKFEETKNKLFNSNGQRLLDLMRENNALGIKDSEPETLNQEEIPCQTPLHEIIEEVKSYEPKEEPEFTSSDELQIEIIDRNDPSIWDMTYEEWMEKIINDENLAQKLHPFVTDEVKRQRVKGQHLKR